jgi:osmoprotectant transport system substrate-binding protein
MTTLLHSFKARVFAFLAVMLLLVLSACGSTSTGTTGGASSTPNPNASITLTIGGKLDTEAQLLTKLYALVLKHAGFNVVERAKLGTNDVVFNAIKSGQIDLYPEFTATGLAKLGKSSSGNAQQDYQTIKQGYESNYQITWLDASPLNDTYGVCTTQTKATSLNATKISDLASKASNLTIATPPDGVQYGVGIVKTAYGITFKKVVTYNEEGLTFPAVSTGTQDLNICYTTSADIAKYKFVLLQDDKNAFPVYNPAPIIRDSVLQKSPQIATILNKLAPYLTTEVSQQLQSQVVNDGQSVTEVATKFLQSKGLL